MILQNEKAVKQWFRGIPLLKKDLDMKITFYQELMTSSRNMGQAGNRHEGYYLAQAERLQVWMKLLCEDMEKLMGLLDADERAILHTRYIKGHLWDAMEFHVYYSRRQAIRIHDRAIRKLIGQEVADVYGKSV